MRARRFMYYTLLCIMVIYLLFGCGTAVKCPKFSSGTESFPTEYCSENIPLEATDTATNTVLSELYWDNSLTSEE